MQSLKTFTDAVDKKSSQTDMPASDDTVTALGIVVSMFVCVCVCVNTCVKQPFSLDAPIWFLEVDSSTTDAI